MRLPDACAGAVRAEAGHENVGVLSGTSRSLAADGPAPDAAPLPPAAPADMRSDAAGQPSLAAHPSGAATPAPLPAEQDSSSSGTGGVAALNRPFAESPPPPVAAPESATYRCAPAATHPGPPMAFAGSVAGLRRLPKRLEASWSSGVCVHEPRAVECAIEAGDWHPWWRLSCVQTGPVGSVPTACAK